MDKIYGLVCPLSGEIRYIGKTQKQLTKRLNNHLAEARKKLVSHKQRWLRKCLDMGLLPSIWLLEEVAAGECWKDRERAWISKALELGFDLTNQTIGGEGVSMTDPVTIARWKSNLHTAMEKVRNTPEFKESKSKGAKRAWANHRDTLMTAFAKPETRSKHSARAKRCWDDPDTRKRMMNRWTPEAKAKQAIDLAARQDKIKAAMTPEVRAKQAAKLKETWAKKKAEKLHANRTKEWQAQGVQTCDCQGVDRKEAWEVGRIADEGGQACAGRASSRNLAAHGPSEAAISPPRSAR